MRTPVLRTLVAAAFALAAGGAVLAAERAPEDEITLGDPAAPVQVIEYASVTCPHCAQWNAEVFPAFKAKYVDTGRVQYVFRELPTAPANLAAAGFLTARCAGRDRYLAVVDALFEGLADLAADGNALKYLMRGAEAGGLDEARMRACVSDEGALERLAERVQMTRDEGVRATPTFVIGDFKLEGGQSLADLDLVLEPMLAKP